MMILFALVLVLLASGQANPQRKAACPNDMTFRLSECMKYQENIDMTDINDICSKSFLSLDCMESLLTDCGDKLKVYGVDSSVMQQTRQSLQHVCPTEK